MIASLIDLIPYLSDVCGNNHKVSMGEANKYVSITIPGQQQKKRRKEFIVYQEFSISVDQRVIV